MVSPQGPTMSEGKAIDTSLCLPYGSLYDATIWLFQAIGKSVAGFTDSRLILLSAVADINCRNEAGPTSIQLNHIQV